jgi:hypothetical protein
MRRAFLLTSAADAAHRASPIPAQGETPMRIAALPIICLASLLLAGCFEGSQNAKGEQGAAGPQGPAGERGAPGPKGERGPVGATGASGFRMMTSPTRISCADDETLVSAYCTNPKSPLGQTPQITAPRTAQCVTPGQPETTVVIICGKM